MWWVYILIASVLAFIGGIAMCFTEIWSGTNDYNPWKVLALFLIPVVCYWLGIIGAFMYGLGQAFKGG